MRNLTLRIVGVLVGVLSLTMPGMAAHQGMINSSFSNGSVGVEPTTGSATLSIPIEVPPGRRGIEPNLALLYNSNARNGVMGLGWSLELGSIQRSVKNGVPKYNATDEFIFLQDGGSQELVYDSQAGFYRAKIEGSFMKFEFINQTYWKVTDRNGIVYTFGSTSASQVYHPQDSSKKFRWHLDRIEDKQGNYLTISYASDENCLYPSEIAYTGYQPTNLAPFAKVQFIYENRPDQTFSYISTLRMMINRRLAKIDVLAGGQLQRRYVFNYVQEGEGKFSLLNSITPVGSDGVSTLPPMLFQYSQGKTIFNAPVNFSKADPGDNIGDNQIYHLMDMNSDGVPELLHTPTGSPARYYIYYNQARGGAMDFSSGSLALNSPTLGAYDSNLRFADVNADGLMDVVSGQSCPYQIWLNNGKNGYQAPYQITRCPAYPISHQNSIFLTDMNGDGYPDILYTNGGGYQMYFSAANGQGQYDFGSAVTAVNSPGVGMNNPDARLADFNGDGLLDVIYGQSCPYTIWTNNGVNGYNSPTTISQCPNHSISHQNLLTLVDMNGDGLTDMVDSYTGNNQNYLIYYNNGFMNFNAAVVADNSPIRGTDNPNVKFVDMNNDGLMDVFFGMQQEGWYVWLNKGINGFHPAIAVGQHPGVPLNDPNLVVADMNGDSLPDMLWGTATNLPYKMWIRQCLGAPRPGVLVEVNNSIGGKTNLSYQGLPVRGIAGPEYKISFGRTLFDAVKSVTRSNSLGQVFTATYELNDGFWDPEGKEFRGFGFVKITDPDGNYTWTSYYQDDLLKGRMNSQEFSKANNRVLSLTLYQWNIQNLSPDSVFVSLKRSDDYIYNGDWALGRRRAMLYFYEETPQYGNLTRTIDFGTTDLDSGNDRDWDSVTTELSYHNNVSAWLLGFPKEKIIRSREGDIVRRTWFYYDNRQLNDLPLKGLLTKRVDWAGGGAGVVDPAVQSKYDTYGNLTSTIDPKGKATTISYDTQYKVFPVLTTNALGHQAKNEYYGVAGVPLNSDGYMGLWGQVKSGTDPNGQISRNVYDVFGRLVKTVGPLDSITYPSTTHEYLLGSTYSRFITKQIIQHGQSNYISSTTFMNGWGQLLQTKVQSEVSGQYVVSGQAEYNSQGLPVKQYLPYFTANDSSVLDSINTSRPNSKTTYDPFGRVKQTTNPDGTYASVIYDDTFISRIDENGHKHMANYDIRGNLLERYEYTGADGRSLYYPAQSYVDYGYTHYTHDILNNLVSTRDDHGHRIDVTYDTLGRKRSMIDPDMGTWQYGYDLNGNMITQKDAKGQSISFTYDVINRLTKKANAAGSVVTYTYDDPGLTFSKGRMSWATYGGGNTQFEYDKLGREIRSTKKIDSKYYPVNREYDALNRVTKIIYSDGYGVSYQYNSAGQVERLIDSDGRQLVTNVDYDAAGQITGIYYGNGTISTRSYDSRSMRLTKILTTNGQGVRIQDLTYSYDSVGNIIAITDAVNTATQTFQYDALNRLVGAQGQNYGTKQFQYNEIGNIMKKDGIDYVYGENGAGPHAVTSLNNGTTFTYDKNGNMIAKRVNGVLTEFNYDVENRLLSIKRNGSQVAQYVYDGDGGRTKKVIQGQSSPTTHFIGSLSEINGTRVTDFIYLGGQRIAGRTGGSPFYYHPDHLGGVNVVSDSQGVTKEIIEYQPFGETARQDRFGAQETTWHYYTGQRKDDESGLYFYGARYYDPSLGRFITSDSLVQSPSDPQSFNRYSYCRNNPINYIDPTGRKWSWKKFWNSFGGAFVGAAATVLTGGAGAPLWAAGMYGGMVGGAITGGLEGGWQGALIGATAGGALGAVGGWGVDKFGWQFGVGMLAAGAGVAGATNSWSSFAGGFAGGMSGAAVGNGIEGYFHDPLSSQDPAAGVQRENIVEGRGIGTTAEKALRVANEKGNRVLYTQSRGIASDIVRGGMQLLFKNSLASRQFAQYLQANPNTIYNLHSEMTLTALGAAKSLRVQGIKVGGSFRLVSPFYSEATARAEFNAIGAAVNYVPPSLADSAGMFATFTPITAPIYGTLGIITLEHFHSYKFYESQTGR